MDARRQGQDGFMGTTAHGIMHTPQQAAEGPKGQDMCLLAHA